MRTAAAALIAALALTGAVRAQEPEIAVHGPPKAVAELLRQERAFAARSREAGPKTAFAEYMDPADSRAFQGGDPLRGAAAIGDMHKGPGQLDWQAKEVFASKGGDMGVVWGTFQFTVPKTPLKVTGRYVTAWRKDAKGRWKAIIDTGTPDSTTP